jgi:adenine-specific DNA methylase
MIEVSRIGNPFAERHLLIARLDHLSRNEDLQAKLAATDRDMIVVDESHKMAAHYFGREVKEIKLAYRLYTLCERKKWAKEALAYNALVVSWPEIVRLAAERPMEASGQQTLG